MRYLMNDFLYAIYAIALAVLAFFTGELVTFIMLGIVLMALNNMLRVQKEILRKLDHTKNESSNQHE